jgi:hypothetical protein
MKIGFGECVFYNFGNFIGALKTGVSLIFLQCSAQLVCGKLYNSGNIDKWWLKAIVELLANSNEMIKNLVLRLLEDSVKFVCLYTGKGEEVLTVLKVLIKERMYSELAGYAECNVFLA